MKYKKPNMSLLRSGGYGRGIIGENSLPPSPPRVRKRSIYRAANRRKKRRTETELEFENILDSLGNGVFRGRYNRVHIFKNWTLDFYLYEVGLAIDIDDKWAISQAKKEQKAADCASARIILVRFSKQEIFGDRELLVNKLREAYREALRMSKEKKC